MIEQGGATGGEHPVVCAGSIVAAAAAAVMEASGLSLSLAQAKAAAVSLHEARQALEAAHLHVVRLLLEKEDAPLHPGAGTRHFLTDALGIGAGASGADLAAARATDPHTGVLRGMGAALAAGEVSRAHVDVAVRTVRQLPTGLVRDRRGDVDEVLTGHSRIFCPTDAAALARYLLATIDPDGVEDHADEAFERRSWRARADRSGMVSAEGVLEPVGGAEYLAVLRHLSAPGRTSATRGRPGDDDSADDSADAGEAAAAVDLRTRAQREADAQVEMARLAAQALKLELPGAEPPRVVVHTTVDQLAAHRGPCPRPDANGDGDGDRGRRGEDDHGGRGDAGRQEHPGPATCEQTGPLSTATLHRLACDAVIERVVLDDAGAVVAMNSLGRLASRAQRRALAARDGGCTWPGCSAPPSWCDAHHVLWWSRGGPTELVNLVLLCGRHHTEAHREQWVITMAEGVPWFVPPRWVDPNRTPVRNTFHTAVSAALRTGARLALGQALDPGDVPP